MEENPYQAPQAIDQKPQKPTVKASWIVLHFFVGVYLLAWLLFMLWVAVILIAMLFGVV